MSPMPLKGGAISCPSPAPKPFDKGCRVASVQIWPEEDVLVKYGPIRPQHVCPTLGLFGRTLSGQLCPPRNYLLREKGVCTNPVRYHTRKSGLPHALKTEGVCFAPPRPSGVSNQSVAHSPNRPAVICQMPLKKEGSGSHQTQPSGVGC